MDQLAILLHRTCTNRNESQ